jgi:metal-dependent amidase/aminoacylase/carboxypeptidase family protein
MIKNGGYRSMDVCLMAHPTPYTGLIPMLAVSECVAEFFGHKYVRKHSRNACLLTSIVHYRAHAAGAPWEGVNALDAAVLAYSNISALRQQTHPDSRIHGIIMGSEEWVCNIIPGHSKIQCKEECSSKKRYPAQSVNVFIVETQSACGTRSRQKLRYSRRRSTTASKLLV